MSGEYGVDTDELKRLTERMAEVEARAEASVAAMNTEVDGLHATFTGQAATAHAAAHAKWTEGAKQMREALRYFQAGGMVAHTNYTSATTTNTAMWS
ncbi:WXG100 family type VII secretion target [Mycobacteroides abscessus]|uniref:WXG100 family type VII secretion target n=1 Tax=Mycobacteroides abscessus TaxID=36809 RepID=A0ABD7HH73_9MYCO|nr:WXG100 family type VII secretion target [Mycobacteroides abscessus]PVB15927.1 WXG100 family type VII secretion target [Mycobacteroides abscessus]RIR40397.1 WXG100 family type VII secretion target [Mycobacteroides abscessus]RIS62012.1 WXG100 family type VII secretion target [Mycobacteroides abscessus]RIT29259.1 WXG100 family type VII secretion target [Mycobacteroides abscessus]